MLIRYKKSQEKIAMGLLSFMPKDNDVKSLQATIREYETNENWHLYFWRHEDDIIGLVGVQIEDETRTIIQHISVNPSFRNAGIGCRMVEAIRNLYCDEYDVCGDEATEGFLSKCKDMKNEEDE
ncbi:MAG TPA: GNAT family N-acetyltransferase [Pseudogracilibacillus sp.]|nr:GNAT family N-acetyltransferase [Pseudogracilibacillus sp.]